MKKCTYLVVALVAFASSSCQKKAYTCQCKLAFTPGEHNLIWKRGAKEMQRPHVLI